MEDVLRDLFSFWQSDGRAITNSDLTLRIMAGVIVMIGTGMTGYALIKGVEGLLQIMGAIAQFLVDIGESIKTLAGGTNAVLNGIGAFITALGAIPTGIGNAITLISTGVKSLLSTPETFVVKGFETWKTQIEADREATTLSVTNGDRSFSLEVRGRGANSATPQIVENLDNLLEGPFIESPQLPFQQRYAALPNPDAEVLEEKPRGLLTRMRG